MTKKSWSRSDWLVLFLAIAFVVLVIFAVHTSEWANERNQPSWGFTTANPYVGGMAR